MKFLKFLDKYEDEKFMNILGLILFIIGLTLLINFGKTTSNVEQDNKKIYEKWEKENTN